LVGMSKRAITLAGLLIVIISSLFLTGSAQAEQLVEVADELVVVIPEKYPPYYLINENNKPDGFAINVFESVASRIGLSFRYEIKSNWIEVCEALKNGTADVVPLMGITAEREQYTLFTSTVETFPVSVFVRNSNLEINKQDDLKGHEVAIVTDECGYQFLADRKNVFLKKFDHFDMAFQSLISGQVDAMVYPQTVMQDIVNTYDLNDKIRVINPPLIEIKRAIGVRKTAPVLKNNLEVALQAFITSDQYNELYRKWFVYQKPFWNVEKVFWSMAVLLLLVVGIFLLIRHRELLALNTTLQQQITLATQQLSQSNEYLRDLTVTDTLTGISNRRAFENSLQEFMSRAVRYGNKFSMLIFDIDDFKRLNDEFGHDMGDRVLTELVDRVSEVVRDVDVLSRWGGEEFTILMLQTEKEGALRMAERCRHIVADSLFDEVGPVTISLGVTCFQAEDNERKLFKRADDALYQAKAEGKNRVVWIGEKCGVSGFDG